MLLSAFFKLFNLKLKLKLFLAVIINDNSMKITSMRISGLFCPRSAPARVEFSTTSNFILSPTNVMKQIKTTVSPMLSPFGSQNPTPIWSPKQDSFSILLTSFFLNEMWCDTNQSETRLYQQAYAYAKIT